MKGQDSGWDPLSGYYSTTRNRAEVRAMALLIPVWCILGLFQLTLPPMTSRSGKRVHDPHPAPIRGHGQRSGLAFKGKGRTRQVDRVCGP